RALPTRPGAHDHRLAEALDPVRLVHSDEPDAPRQGIAAAAGDSARHQRVEHRPLRHPEASHDRQAEGGEHPGFITAAGAPGNLAPEAALSFACDLEPLVPRLL